MWPQPQFHATVLKDALRLFTCEISQLKNLCLRRPLEAQDLQKESYEHLA